MIVFFDENDEVTDMEQSETAIPCSSSTSRSERASQENPPPETTSCPQIPLRYGRKTLDVDIMTAIVHIQATYKVSGNDVMGICVDLANMVLDSIGRKKSVKKKILHLTEKQSEGDR